MTRLPFSDALLPLLSPVIDTFAKDIGNIAGLQRPERECIVAAAHTNLMSVLHAHVARTLLLELHIARKEGCLNGTTSVERWQYFIESASGGGFWRDLYRHYPALQPRLHRILQNRRAAVLAFASAWATDRASLGTLCSGPAGLLQDLRFNAGDSHRQGHTVVIVTCEGGKLVYKPRPLDIDIALSGFLHDLADTHPEPISAAVPRAWSANTHGWAAFIGHRYAANEDELRDFYHGIGQWLGVLRLLGGTDMHAQNLIADGARPVIVDCETLFTPRPDLKPSGYGDAVDQAAHRLLGTVLGTGMLPGRAQALGWRGFDTSSVGALPGQQPATVQPAILEAGTDEARWGTISEPPRPAHNHPAPAPVLADHWPQILHAFDRINSTLRRLDGAGRLRARLSRFADCTVRIVPRPTETYAELARMLWHPVSLRHEEGATTRARELLCRMAAHASLAPEDAAVIDAEIADLKQGDIPYFSMVAKQGQPQDQHGNRWLHPRHRVEAALDNWRAADLGMERSLIRAALPSAYLNDDVTRGPARVQPGSPRPGNVDKRRRALLAALMQQLPRHAIHGEDGTVTWLAPGFDPDIGWSIRPMGQDLYSGLAGMALLIAAYRHESRAGRADPIEGLDALLQGVVSTMLLAEEKQDRLRADALRIRPLPPGGYVGLGSLMWTWLTLDALGGDDAQNAATNPRPDARCGVSGVRRARELALRMPEAVAASKTVDVLYGLAGAIPPLLSLAQCTADPAYLAMAEELGDKLYAAATMEDGRACWAHSRWPHGLGGFSHGATGIGWALAMLAQASGNIRYRDLATAAFAFEENLYDARSRNWLDLRAHPNKKTMVAWCHGAVGIGLAHLDLDPDMQHEATRLLVRRAAAATWRAGFSVDHGVCHGNAASWEFLDATIAKGEGPPGVSREAMLAEWLTQLEHDIPRSVVPDTYAHGFMTGSSGIAYQLLRAEPQNELPSVLTLGNPRWHRSRLWKGTAGVTPGA